MSNNLVEGKNFSDKENLEEAILGPIRVETGERFGEERDKEGIQNAFNMGNQFGTISEASEDYGSDASFLKDGGNKRNCKIFKTGSMKEKSREVNSRIINAEQEKLIEKIKDVTTLSNEEEKSEENICLLYTSPSPRDKRQSRMPSSA